MVTLTSVAAQKAREILEVFYGQISRPLRPLSAYCVCLRARRIGNINASITYALTLSVPTPWGQIFDNPMIKIFVDKNSLPLVIGSVIDYKKEGFNEGFVINNPNNSRA